ncbi:MAG: hypothetical protein JO309_05330 [Pseudonocardiales bacterium]|nr:hypothetical protein [Pseudonocardiales bacterium]MBV9728820.1 hypothetical protein [Pseudonocardiales bacterium]
MSIVEPTGSRSERPALLRHRSLGVSEFASTLSADEVRASSEPEVVRGLFCALDEASYHLDAAGDGIAALSLLRSIAQSYAGRFDPVPQTPPDAPRRRCARHAPELTAALAGEPPTPTATSCSLISTSSPPKPSNVMMC